MQTAMYGTFSFKMTHKRYTLYLLTRTLAPTTAPSSNFILEYCCCVSLSMHQWPDMADAMEIFSVYVEASWLLRHSVLV